ncbi:hypothetical protein [Bradyrhizobium sp. BR 1433]|uniref:hypothetical protein n=1 Tax=Bradyrhizobium sp. BR 1433 TaxID=3447967 RepID=UPI003EE69BFC
MDTKPGNKPKAAATPFAQATVQHAQALQARTIRDVQIVSRIVTALGLRPPIKPAAPLSRLLGGDANNWDIALMLMAYPSFKHDGLVLQKGDAMNADTLGDMGDLVFAWYASDGWTIQT